MHRCNQALPHSETVVENEDELDQEKGHKEDKGDTDAGAEIVKEEAEEEKPEGDEEVFTYLCMHPLNDHGIADNTLTCHQPHNRGNNTAIAHGVGHIYQTPTVAVTSTAIVSGGGGGRPQSR